MEKCGGREGRKGGTCLSEGGENEIKEGRDGREEGEEEGWRRVLGVRERGLHACEWVERKVGRVEGKRGGWREREERSDVMSPL